MTIHVEGTRTDAEAHKIAKAVADSALVKTAIFGGDPNWGRIVSAAGYAGVAFEEADLSLYLGDFLLYDRGTPLPFDAATASAFIKNNRDSDYAPVVHSGHRSLHLLHLRSNLRIRAAQRRLHHLGAREKGVRPLQTIQGGLTPFSTELADYST